MSNYISVLKTDETTLSDAQFRKIAQFMEENVGIKMPESKKLMIQARLSGRLKALHFRNFNQYIDYVFADHKAGQEEMILMIDALTTNLTHFFRENSHFEYMTRSVLPEFQKKGLQKLEIWSAGCSSGEEPYTLSMVMHEALRTMPQMFMDYKILATDISTKVLNKAMNAVYPMSSVDKLSYDLKKRYFLRSCDHEKALVRVKEDVRNKVSFQRLNFMDSNYASCGMKNIIFCRNVLIYFDKSTQEAVVRKLVNQLVPGGYLFLGHSETIFGMNLPLQNMAPTVFRKIS